MRIPLTVPSAGACCPKTVESTVSVADQLPVSSDEFPPQPFASAAKRATPHLKRVCVAPTRLIGTLPNGLRLSCGAQCTVPQLDGLPSKTAPSASSAC